jgi:alpha-tubulin suppressor-like RCC1 family protein
MSSERDRGGLVRAWLPAAGVALALGGCYRSEFPQCAITCAADSDCPGGLTCNLSGGAGLCSSSDSCFGAIDATDGQDDPDAATASHRWRVVQAGGATVCAIDVMNQLYCWGDNREGQAGQDPLASRYLTYPTLIDVGVTGSWLAVSVGLEHACGIFDADPTNADPGGALYCWGSNQFLQAGAETQGLSLPGMVEDDERWVHVAAAGSGTHTCGVKLIAGAREGYCWGSNSYGQVDPLQNVGTSIPLSAKVQRADMIQKFALGLSHSCALTSGGSLQCWGGEASVAHTMTGRSAPCGGPCPVGDVEFVTPPTGLTWTELTACENHSCAAASSGEVYCWGESVHGQLGLIGTTTGVQDTARIAARAGNRNLSSVTAGANVTCAVETASQKIYCFGSNDFGELGDNRGGATANRSPGYVDSAVARGNMMFSMVTAGGRGSSVADNDQAGAVCAIDLQGALWCWGDNAFGQLGNGFIGQLATAQPVSKPRAGEWLSITTGAFHTCAVLSDDLTSSSLVYCWGRNAKGQAGQPAADAANAPVSVVEIPDSSDVPLKVSSSLDFTCVTTDSNADGLGDDGYCWGVNQGWFVNDFVNHFAPVRLFRSGNAAVSDVVAGHSLAAWQFPDGTFDHRGEYDLVVPAGYSVSQLLTHGPLGALVIDDASSTETRMVVAGACVEGGTGLVPMPAIDDAIAVSAPSGSQWLTADLGQDHTCAISNQDPSAATAGGVLYCWGSNPNGELGIATSGNNCDGIGDQVSLAVATGDITDEWTAVSAGSTATCGIRAGGGKVECWGYATKGELGRGQIGVSSAAPDRGTLLDQPSAMCASQISIATTHGCAIMSPYDDTTDSCEAAGTEVYCWGSNSNGQLGVLTGAGTAWPEPIVAPAP